MSSFEMGALRCQTWRQFALIDERQWNKNEMEYFKKMIDI